VAVAHALGTGTDNGSLWLWLVAAGCVGLVVACVAWRLSTGFAARPGEVVARQLAGVR
jgi:sulfoxide reductase heme-binding subunit YedZ